MPLEIRGIRGISGKVRGKLGLGFRSIRNDDPGFEKNMRFDAIREMEEVEFRVLGNYAFYVG